MATEKQENNEGGETPKIDRAQDVGVNGHKEKQSDSGDKPKVNGKTLSKSHAKEAKADTDGHGGKEPKTPKHDDYPPLPFDSALNDCERRERERANAYTARGIRFAPWNIPYRRRLQTLAVLIHSLSIALTVSIFFFLCAIPLIWPLLIPYLVRMLTSKAATDGRLRSRSERFRRLPVWRFFGDYYPAKLHKTHELPATRKYIFGYHPHGIISHGAFAAFATEALGFADKFPGITNSLLTLDSNFRIPLYRDYILNLGIQSVSKESITNILTRGGANNEGMGRAVTIVVGGARESLEAQPGTLRLVLAERKGFVKMAIRTGADLVPVLAFGENDLYDQVSPKSHPKLHRLQMFVLRTLKFTLPFLHGRGIFNYDVGLMPYRRPLNVVVGAPIMVAQAADANSVDPAEIDRLHELYVTELEKMWHAYKDVFARGRQEEMTIFK
ncbi:diacylglycerol acyltransferase-domain-containing protein [Lasiosphaeria miniovina]|uniref:Diacylglycerol O-acyltransferase n=1 Tax=Lasiosphaeria miniovina TaxID=1954250 RepID=A0AA40BGL2_9PEZI|nr:diacylglycerol acyltransferase-domain-containing protein [Lasiosphaeria miniovina]KAK0733862.1 diacylglycerol acyltransferase-domain-containing protein [Lasiosphaeria miniovina]